ALSVLREMAGLASDRALSPVTPEMLAAREFRRGTLKLLSDLAPFKRLGFQPPQLSVVLNRADSITVDARLIRQGLRQTFAEDPGVQVLETVIPSSVTYRHAATLGQPVHRIETRRPHGRQSPAALDVMRDLACELFPEWREAIAKVTGSLSPLLSREVGQ